MQRDMIMGLKQVIDTVACTHKLCMADLVQEIYGAADTLAFSALEHIPTVEAALL